MADAPSILIVEDQPAHQLMVRKCLERVVPGARLVFAPDGEVALDLIFARGRFRDRGTHPLPGLILLDIKTPRADGYRVLAALRVQERSRHLPVVMLTSSATDVDRRRCHKLGAQAYLVKPVTDERLSSTLRDLNLPGLVPRSVACLGSAAVPNAKEIDR